VAVLIPSIDLMDGKIVQLVQGEKKKLEFDNFDYWIQRFSKYAVVQLIDLDAARGAGNNRSLVKEIISQLPCQVGGGVRDVQTAEDLLSLGARKVIIGSALLHEGRINTSHARELAESVPKSALMFALDSRGGRVAIDGWRQQTTVTAIDMIRELEPFCESFLYTHIDTEGLMGGIPMETVHSIRHATTRHLVVAGGITRQEEIDTLGAMGIDAVVGMALYMGKIPG
jgi:phosphoribosylformimino-5-aminoimidazole carboxamide ribotide isomerase